MAPLREIDANRRPRKVASEKVPARPTKLLSKTPSVDEIVPQSISSQIQTLDQAARAMTEKLSRKRPFGEVEEEAVPETDVEASTQSQQLPLQTSEAFAASTVLAHGLDDEEDEEEDGYMELVYDPSQIRKKINMYLKSGEMKVKEFQEKLDVSSPSYYNFMKARGKTGGMQSQVYLEAHKFFVNREEKGVQMPKPKKAKTSRTQKQSSKPDADKENDDPATSPSNAKKSKKDDKGDKYDVSGIELPLENLGRVPVFDTCDDIRTKINQHFRTSGQTQAAFGRTIGETHAIARLPEPHAVPGRSISQFLTKKGPTAGNTSQAFYAAYVYFEKLRIKNKKNKSKKRQEMEEVHGADGLDIQKLTTNGFLCGPGERPYEDKYGKIDFAPVGAYRRGR